MVQTLELWGHWGPQIHGEKVCMILEELSLPYKIHYLEFSEVKNESYLQITPNGRLPALKDPNTWITLWESGAIILYLVDQYDMEGKISYKDSPEKYLCQQWLAFQISGQGPYFGQATWFARFHPEKLPSAIDRYANEIPRVIGVIERALSKNSAGNWLVGDKCLHRMPNIRPTPTILLPRLPAKTLVGLDLLSFTSTEQFYGISDLTPGWHFLYTGTTESFSIRCGAWFYVRNLPFDSVSGSNDSSNSIIRYNGTATTDGPDIRIWKWNKHIETLVPMKGDNDENRLETMRWKANLGGLRQMGALFSYRTKGLPESTEVDEDELSGKEPTRKDWVRLTNRITPEILSRILGTPFSDDDDRPSWSINSASTAARDADNIPGITGEMASEVRTNSFGGGEEGQKEKELQFLPIDLKRTWREGAIGRERTEAAQDRSWALGDLIRRYSSPKNNDEKKGEGEILGELQFCFLMILTLMNYSCLEQWKRLLALILTCRIAIKEREPLFRDVLQLLRLQLRHGEDIDGGLFEMDGDYDGNFLRKLLTDFRQSVHQLEESETDGAGSLVRPEMDALEQWVRAEYGWELRKDLIMRRGMLQLEDGEQVEMEMSGADEDDETGEYAPVIVDTGDGTGQEHEATDVDTPMD
ncbi:AAR2 family protein [Talaromyces stipitatus ATCC 10500]|uniref:AAR2 family protein n=1 Tax=Talaromyces stipitatus (strain ATCC 10500 / CBS 375.48 / QM 6759 / NRRL 1006) TaxID=441959 RepID=B8M8L5_TALSN|nr:AAR2 family protein [Talaromyces stipitatus ATCC 10500]EED20528.1 AAR2 family protein [Talaromyces stipitatus ATCC 10500]